MYDDSEKGDYDAMKIIGFCVFVLVCFAAICFTCAGAIRFTFWGFN